MLSDLISNASIEIECPKCGHKFEQTIGRLKSDPEMPCPGCGTSIQFQAEGLRTALDEVDDATAKFKRNIDNLGN